MAAKNCFHMTASLSTPTVAFLPSHTSLLYRVALPARSSPRGQFSTPSSISCDFVTPHSPARRSSLLVCKAGNKVVSEVQDVTEASWNTLVIGSETPVLVDFWAPWCGPCRIIAPVIDELAKEYAGKITCYKVNTDDCPNIASKYGIRSIPTVLFFKQGEKKESVIGAVPKSTLSATIDKYVDS
uniref:Thioredoxin domain-containing protein n=1 Tax=Kalanchoe fedtschenkoi TaxID=63787 RepID=A0A7N0TN98_KALFE